MDEYLLVVGVLVMELLDQTMGSAVMDTTLAKLSKRVCYLNLRTGPIALARVKERVVLAGLSGAETDSTRFDYDPAILRKALMRPAQPSKGLFVDPRLRRTGDVCSLSRLTTWTV